MFKCIKFTRRNELNEIKPGEREKISEIINYLWDYFRDFKNVDDTYFSLIRDSRIHGVLYDVKTDKGVRKIYTDGNVMFYSEGDETIFMVGTTGDVESKISIRDVSLALQELVELTKKRFPKYPKYPKYPKLVIRNENLDWWN